MTAALPSRRPRPVDCACGKRGWRTKHDADQVVVNAKILRHLHGNNRRQEQRSYRCTTNPALWHVTSQQERAYGATHRPDDDAAAREYIESLLLADGHRNTDAAWERLMSADHAAQTNAVLSLIHQDGLRDGANRKARLAATRIDVRQQRVSQHLYNVEAGEHKEWVLHWTRFQAHLVARKAQVRKAIKVINIAASTTDVARANVLHRDVVARLSIAIAEHRDATADPTPADRALWAALTQHAVPYQGEDLTSLEEMLPVWTPARATEGVDA